ncbi:MEMO1 family [Fusarium sp. MPI-SDFR-AT-0072]|uniref:Protein MEMO1 n=1 Tax=Fusarium oxysporum f. sp. rapae TaxID=485398 RepID=A0A8J5PF58_FUSOX|nr:Protein MEMO1 [Fusarium oxysporum f. sp. rapae]KAH7180764.1 MEMO1 family [Fusarium sp. MPI-SDFR-AT-0072]
MATIRPAGKAGEWYDKDPKVLRSKLQGFLAAVPESLDGVSLPIPEARVIIAPHAGYKFSGPCAAWAYKTLDLSRTKRVIVLGPSHTYYLEGCAATTFEKYETPFGDLEIDQELVRELQDALEMETMPRRREIQEHSLEMHMPYLYLRCQESFDSPDKFPKIVPVLVGSNNGDEENVIGRALLPYLKDPENAFIISSDFCHWGHHFSYLPYSPTKSPSDLTHLRKDGPRPNGPPIHETIRVIDEAAMDAVESGIHADFLATLRQTHNSVCGRHPIGVMMAALEQLRKQPEYKDKGRFRILKYDRSNLVEYPDDMSVSYVSGYAVL